MSRHPISNDQSKKKFDRANYTRKENFYKPTRGGIRF